MGRAIVRQPRVFLMDEPLSNLDAKLRVATRAADRGAAAAARRDHRLRHPRPGRGDDDGRPRRGDEGRRAAAVRHAARALRLAGERVRRRLHRLPGDEPDRGNDRRRRRDARLDGRFRFRASSGSVSRARTAGHGGHRRRATRVDRPRRPTATASRPSSTSSRSSAPRPTCTRSWPIIASSRSRRANDVIARVRPSNAPSQRRADPPTRAGRARSSCSTPSRGLGSAPRSLRRPPCL